MGYCQKTCRCGAVFKIYKDDGVPGCRDVETVECPYCLREIARQFGTCDGTIINNNNVCDELKILKNKYDELITQYREEHGAAWNEDGYKKLLASHQDEVNEILNNRRKNKKRK